MVVCERAYESPSVGPTGPNGHWDGDLAIQPADAPLVRLGVRISTSSYSDYSSQSWSGYRIDLLEVAGGGWLVKVVSVGYELMVGSSEDETERWLGTADGTSWKRVD